MAGDIAMTIILLGMGLDEFSTSPIATPEIKRIISSVSMDQAKEVARQAALLSTGKEVETYAREKLKALVPEIAIEVG